jgi:trimeric autotransporter adhesin
MKKIFFITVVFSMYSLLIVAQSVGINNNTPHASAVLDVKSFTKGMLIPRTSTTSRLAIVDPAKGLILFDTTTSDFWFHNGSAWAQLSVTGNSWNLVGNAIINPDTNFIGTTDNQPLRFRVNNAWAGEIHPATGNVFFGLNAGNINQTGAFNTAIGEHSLFSNTSGSYNTAIGSSTLFSNTTGSENTAQGDYALFSNTTGSFNTASGTDALNSNTTGTENTANGYRALSSNTSGYYNTANGNQALNSNTTGRYNTATGHQALYKDIAGSFNTATGEGALYSNTSGSDNTANGMQALSSNTSGSVNTADGENALASNTTGNNNTASGFDALFFNNTGNNNTAVGYQALAYNRGGNNNIAIGYTSGTHPSTPNIYNTISIGNDDILNAYQNQVFIGNTSTGFIGGKVPWSVISDARVKNTITEDVKGLDFILKLRPVTYHVSNKAITTLTGNKETPDFPGKYDGEKIKYSGFLAQEVEQAAKAVRYDFSGYAAPKNKWGLYTLSYEQFVVPLVKAMQEQQQIINSLQKQVEGAKAEIPVQIGKQQAIIANQQNQIYLLEKRLAALETKK